MENNEENLLPEGKEGSIRMITLKERSKDGQLMTYRVFNKVGTYEGAYICAIEAVQLSPFFGANECYNVYVNDKGKQKIWKRNLEGTTEHFLRDETKPKF